MQEEERKISLGLRHHDVITSLISSSSSSSLRYEAFLKAMYSIPSMRIADKQKTICLSGAVDDKFVPSAAALVKLGYKLFASPEVSEHLAKAKVAHQKLSHDDIIEHIKAKKFELNINFPARDEAEMQYPIRRRSVDFAIPLITNREVAMFWVQALQKAGPMQIKSWQDYWPNAK